MQELMTLFKAVVVSLVVESSLTKVIVKFNKSVVNESDRKALIDSSDLLQQYLRDEVKRDNIFLSFEIVDGLTNNFEVVYQ